MPDLGSSHLLGYTFILALRLIDAKLFGIIIIITGLIWLFQTTATVDFSPSRRKVAIAIRYDEETSLHRDE